MEGMFLLPCLVNLNLKKPRSDKATQKFREKLLLLTLFFINTRLLKAGCKLQGQMSLKYLIYLSRKKQYWFSC